jgi:hypothetical protein
MKRVGKILTAAGVAAMLLLPAQETLGWWRGPGPGYGHGPWRHSYVYDPAYRWGSPATRQYIRDLHLFGPGYANWRRMQRWWW